MRLYDTDHVTAAPAICHVEGEEKLEAQLLGDVEGID